MPTFDFTCTDCKHTFEFTRPFGSKKMPACPKCKSKKTEKMIHAPNIHFKGSGFYKTDSAEKKEAKESREAKESTKAKDAKDKTETKKPDVKEKGAEKKKE